LWQRRFGGDNSIVDKPINLNGESYTVVGVMPARFQFPSSDDQVWAPIAFTSEDAANRNRHYLQVLARLKSGTSLEQAQTEMHAIAARLQQQYPDSNTDLGAAVTSLHEHLVGDIKPALLILLGAVGLVLLIACANVANLQLARGVSRAREIAVRMSVGADRRRVLRQLLTESVLLSVAGGALGVLFAFGAIRVIVALMPEFYVPNESRKVQVDVALSNAMGLGGHNACVLLARYSE
jgi:putative ABC transport system permease protein